jgi:hypothetical protein
MKSRCQNPKATSYAAYGGRGIRICKRWARFENFLADMGPRPRGKTLDRRDVNGNYSPGNCRWATSHMQRVNQRTSKPAASPQADVAEITGMEVPF